MRLPQVGSALLVLAAFGLLAGAVILGLAQEDHDAHDAHEAHSATTSEGQPPALVRVERRLMGTVWSITIAKAPDATARAAAERALDEVDRLEQQLSEWIPTSEISRVNANAGRSPVRVGPELMACVKASLEVARWSDGAYDISWASLHGLWDFSATSRHIPPSEAAVRERLPLWDYRKVLVDEAAQTIFLSEPGMAIGLGGVAKGYALDRAGELLREAGIDNFMIFGGGQILARGGPSSRPWRIGIQHPRRATYFAHVEVSDGSIATSGDYEHAWEHDGVTYHHILDPKTGFPARQSAAVTVISSTALSADAIDTALFVLGAEEGLRRLPSAPGGPHEAVIVDPSMRMWTTPGMVPLMTLDVVVTDGVLGEPLPRAL